MEKTIIIVIVLGTIGIFVLKIKKLLKGEDSCCGCSNLKECASRSTCKEAASNNRQ